MENVGFIKLHRKIIESEIWFKPPEWFKIWTFILWEVNWKANGLPVGSGRFTYKQIQDNCHCTRGQIDKFIRWAKLVDMISTKKSTRLFTICVTNYSQYQSIENDAKSIESRQTVDRESTLYKKKKEERSIENFGELSILEKKIEEFKKYRKEIKKPLGEIGLRNLILGLDKMTKEENIKVAILEQSMINGWQGIFPLRKSEVDNTILQKKVNYVKRSYAESMGKSGQMTPEEYIKHLAKLHPKGEFILID